MAPSVSRQRGSLWSAIASQLVAILMLTVASTGVAHAGATAVALSVGATVAPAFCTPAQRAISRSCAAVDEKLALERYRVAVPGTRPPVRNGGASIEVRVDSTRLMVVKTLRF